MARRPLLRCLLLLAALALLPPLAAMADSCADCLWGSSPECCPPSCCSCCAHGSPALPAAVRLDRLPSAVDAAPHPQEGPVPSFHPRDVFHVPKPSPV